MGRLGNQLFQYAFVRSAAIKNNAHFFCPPWIGDTIFTLDDAQHRTPTATFGRVYRDKEQGFDLEAHTTAPGTDFFGNFESYKYFAEIESQVRNWYRFQPAATARVTAKYAQHNFGEMACLHIRLGDYSTFPWKLAFYTPGKDYFTHSVNLVGACRIAVFSDNIPAARSLLGGLPVESLFIEGNADWEDLFLMTQCRHHVVSSSTFSWWGAWLANAPGKIVIRPAEGRFRPGSRPDNPDFFPDDWVRVTAINDTMWEKYWFLSMQHQVLNAVTLPLRLATRYARGIRRRLSRVIPPAIG